jgi:methionyl-tRNA formyltransferase
MKSTSKTIIFFGNERLVSGLTSTDAPILHGLIERGYNVAAVVSHHSDGQSRNNRKLEVAEIAEAHGIPVLLPHKPAEIAEQLRAYDAVAAVLVAYGRIVPQSIIDIFPKGIINIHPSLLPKYRGPTPIESAIARGDSKTGVSIMQLTAGMDEGPVFAQTPVELSGTETKFDLYTALVKKSSELLFEALPHILDGSLQPTPQDNTQASYCKLLTKNDAWLDLNQLSSIEAERLVRAHLGFPKSKLIFGDHTIIITKAHVSATKKTPLDFVCRDGAFLSIDELIAPSGRTMNAEAFLRGYAAA